MKKKYLFIFMIFNIFFISNVYADNFLITPTDLYVNYLNYGQLQESVQSSNLSGNAWFNNSNSTGNTGATAIKASYYYDLRNYDYDYFSITIYTATKSGNVSVNFDSIACESVNSPAGFTNSAPYHSVISTFICQNTRKQDFINIFSPSNYSDKIYIGQYIAFYNDKNSATIQTAINNQTQQQQQQNQVINNTDTSQQSTNFESTVQNFVVPDTAGIQGVLLQVQSFMSGLEASGRCTPVRIPIPFTEYVVNIPCMTSTVYSVYFPEILVIYQIIVRGIVYYYILVNLLKLFKESIDPFNYRIEVLDL